EEEGRQNGESDSRDSEQSPEARPERSRPLRAARGEVPERGRRRSGSQRDGQKREQETQTKEL
ncbi:DnaJ domain-containing protein, partial [Toxoplasma gondii ARI]